MIYPDVPLQDWVKKYSIEIEALECECGRKIVPSKPFLTPDFAGVAAEDCLCGNQNPGEVFVFQSAKEGKKL